MNLQQYIIVVLVAQTVRSNTIGNRITEDRTSNDTDIGLPEENSELLSPVVQLPSDDVMSSSELLLHSIVSPKFETTTLPRVRRGSKTGRRKKCDAACKKQRRKARKPKKPKKSRKGRKCKKGKKGDKGGKRKKCRRTPRPPKKPSPKSTPVNQNLTSLFTTVRASCIRSSNCPEGFCCARHHDGKVCKPMKKQGDICSRPRRKNRRNVDHYEMCECEPHLECMKTDRSRLFTCQPKT